ncbi:MAG: iron-sulfur cluster assembly scaffold protein [Rhodopirellula sp. JB055]|uniref:iron-sulfur cluster assembly scaffold protein n=1 Tax=Rhodopirellula sp. JB055 TaxID=3342846 RepID=UPI00370A1EF4
MPIEHDSHDDHVQDHYEDPYHRGTLETATHMGEGTNSLCSDRIVITTQLDDSGNVKEAWFDGDGCVISQASASMLMEHVEGKPVEEVKAFTPEQMLDLFGAKLTPEHEKCCLLAWKTLQSALNSRSDDDFDALAPSGPSLGEEQ